MPDDLNDDANDDGSSDRTVTLSRSQIRALEKKANERDELATKVAKLEREAAFRSAGIDPADKKASYFVAGYSGELTVDAIQKEATEIGLIAPPAMSDEQKAEAAAAQQVAAAAAGAPPQSAASEAAVVSELEKAYASGGSAAMLAAARKYGAVSVEEYT